MYIQQIFRSVLLANRLSNYYLYDVPIALMSPHPNYSHPNNNNLLKLLRFYLQLQSQIFQLPQQFTLWERRGFFMFPSLATVYIILSLIRRSTVSWINDTKCTKNNHVVERETSRVPNYVLGFVFQLTQCRNRSCPAGRTRLRTMTAPCCRHPVRRSRGTSRRSPSSPLTRWPPGETSVSSFFLDSKLY